MAMSTPTGIITPALMKKLRAEFALDWHGIHGVRHWGRVRANGLRLAGPAGANARVVELFAVLHDCCRRNDGYDPGHGQRAAENVLSLQERFFDLGAHEIELLQDACARHSDGEREADPTVQVCWDADRLDLGRVGIEPLPARLCTAAARDPETIAWAYRRSMAD